MGVRGRETTLEGAFVCSSVLEPYRHPSPDGMGVLGVYSIRIFALPEKESLYILYFILKGYEQIFPINLGLSYLQSWPSLHTSPVSQNVWDLLIMKTAIQFAPLTPGQWWGGGGGGDWSVLRNKDCVTNPLQPKDFNLVLGK